MSITDGIGAGILGGGGGVSLPTDDVGAVLGGVVGGPALLGVDGSGDGVLMTALDVAAQVLAWTEIDASDAGWTRTPGAGAGAVTTVVSSRLHTELTGTVNDHSGSFDGPRHAFALPAVDGARWCVAARVSFSGLDANGRVNFSVRAGTTQVLGLTVRDNGDLEVMLDSSSPTATITASFASGGWLRLDRRGGSLDVLTGSVSATLSGVTWTHRASYAVPSGGFQLALTSSLAAYSSPPATTLTSDVGPIHWRAVS
jgi:hypothetical protein